MREKLFHRDFTLVVIGQIISLLGNAVLRFVLPLYLLDITGSRSLFGLCSAAAFVPMVVLDFFTCALVALTALALGHLPLVPVLVAAMMLLYGISGAYQPAGQALYGVLLEQLAGGEGWVLLGAACGAMIVAVAARRVAYSAASGSSRCMAETS